MKASWESLVNFKDLEATQRTELISGNAQWLSLIHIYWPKNTLNKL